MGSLIYCIGSIFENISKAFKIVSKKANRPTESYKTQNFGEIHRNSKQ